MRKNSDESDLLALAVGALLVLPVVSAYWAVAGDKEWKRVVGIIVIIIWMLSSIFNPS